MTRQPADDWTTTSATDVRSARRVRALGRQERRGRTVKVSARSVGLDHRVEHSPGAVGVSLLVREAGRPLCPTGPLHAKLQFVRRRGKDSRGEATVRGLVPPPLLIDMLAAGSWQHPGDAVMREIIPWFEDPLIFLTSLDHMRGASGSMDMFARDRRLSELFREIRGSKAGPVDLPWLDVERAFLVAVNRVPGDDVAIALDYRADPSDPRVVASDFWTDPPQCAWRIVAPTFGAFAAALGLLGEQSVAGFPAGEPDGPVV